MPVDVIQDLFDCIGIPPAPEPMELNLPGGLQLKHQHVLDQAAPALAPLVPIFDIIATIKAIPEAFMSLNFSNLLKMVGKLVRLLPAASVPITVINLLDAILAELQDLRSKLGHIVAQVEKANEVAEVAAELDDPELLDIAECAKGNCKKEAENAGKSLATVDMMLTTIKTLLGLAGLSSIADQIPSLADITSGLSGDLNQVFVPLDFTINTLAKLGNEIPLP